MPPMRPAGTTADPDLRERLLGAIPALRAFAHSLAEDGERGDDLVQDTLLRAWTGADGAAREGDTAAWLFTILHRLFHAERSAHRARGDRSQSSCPAAAAETERERFREALQSLPDAQREALILVGAQRFTYREAAAICGVAVGTLKSRAARARIRLAAELECRASRKPAVIGRPQGRGDR